MAGLRIRPSSRLPRRAKPGGRRRRRPAAGVASPVARGGQDSFLSFASVLPSLGFREQTVFLDWVEKGACLHGQTHTAFEPSPNNPARFCQGRAGGLRGSMEAGEGKGQQTGPRAPRDGGRRGGAGSCPFQPSRIRSSLLLFFIAAARSCLR